jgi:organic hydroperoxide reductase OsmC/OhrA
MGKHQVRIAWRRGDAAFVDSRYSRAHEWIFDGGARVPGSSSPFVVPVPLSDPARVDPEEALVAAASSCHMLWFLSIAAGKGFVVDTYEDQAVGTMGRNAQGKVAMTRIALRPDIRFSGDGPTARQVREMHEASHGCCMVANSLITEIVVEDPVTQP